MDVTGQFFWTCSLILSSGLVLLGLTLIFIRTTLVLVTVESWSMAPFLEQGDRVLVLRYWPRRWLRQGYMVIVQPWNNLSTESKRSRTQNPFIKRIVGMPGDHLPQNLVTELADLHGKSGQPGQNAVRPQTIPPGHILVCGDNIQSSLNSFLGGLIPLQNILGVVILKLPRREGGVTWDSIQHSSAVLLGQPAPPFTAKTLDGASVTLTHYLGRSVAFLFISADTNLIGLIHYYEILRPQARRVDVEFVLVSLANAAQTQVLIDGLDSHLPILIAPRESNPFFNNYQLLAVPSYCLLNKEGKIQSAGYPTPEFGDWKALVDT